jgi:hypothetical protein
MRWEVELRKWGDVSDIFDSEFLVYIHQVPKFYKLESILSFHVCFVLANSW